MRTKTLLMLIGQACLTIVGGFLGTLSLRTEMVSAQPGVRSSVAQNGRGLVPRVLDLELSSAPIGTVIGYSGDWPPVIERNPDGTIKTQVAEADFCWQKCKGQLLDQSRYPDLYLAIGKRYGYESEKFRLPDYQGYFLRGVGGKDNSDPPSAVNKEGFDKEVGHKQRYATALPRKPFKTGGDEDGHHSHGDKTSGLITVDGMHTFTGQNVDFDKTKKEPNLGTAVELNKGGHYHVLKTGGDAETRPQNVSVHWLIRVR